MYDTHPGQKKCVALVVTIWRYGKTQHRLHRAMVTFLSMCDFQCSNDKAKMLLYTISSSVIAQFMYHRHTSQSFRQNVLTASSVAYRPLLMMSTCRPYMSFHYVLAFSIKIAYSFRKERSILTFSKRYNHMAVFILHYRYSLRHDWESLHTHYRQGIL